MQNNLTDEKIEFLAGKAKEIRISIIEMLVAAGSGHSAGPVGMADIFTALYFYILRHNPKDPFWEDRDRLILSNGHINTVLYATGKQGNAADIESANSEFLSITDGAQSGLDFGGDFSFSIWVKFETLPASGNVNNLLSKFNLGTDGAYSFGLYNNAGTYYWRATVYDSTTPSENLSGNVGSAVTPSADTWYHVVWTFTESNYTSQVYINGTSIGTYQHTGYSGTMNNSAGPFKLGQLYAGGSDGFLDGLLDEIGVWNKVLSSDEVTELYNSGNALNYAQTAGVVDVTVTPSTQSATFSAIAYATKINFTRVATALTALFSVPTYTVVSGSMRYIASVVVGSFSLISRSVNTSIRFTASALSATFSTIALTLVLSITVVLSTVVATFTTALLEKTGSVWTKRSRNASGDWTRRSRNSE
jgi:hypothetical protein